MDETKNQNQPSEKQEERSPVAELFDYVDIFVFSVCVVVIIFSLFVRLCRVDGPSMNKTLIDGEMLIISDIAYEPEQFDVIVFHQTSAEGGFNEPIVKRVIATENHYVKIDFDNSKVYVSDDDVFDESEVIDESDYAFFDTGKWRSSGTMVKYVPEGKLFVMGDNRNHSADSRSPSIGLVDTRRVLGKVLLRITPFSKFGPV